MPFSPLILAMINLICLVNSNKETTVLEHQQFCENITIEDLSFLSPFKLFHNISVNIALKSIGLLTECNFAIHLEYYPPNFWGNLTSISAVINRKVLKWSAESDEVQQVEFECWNFVVPGLYRITMSNIAAEPTQWINISTDQQTHLHLPGSASIFPSCQNDFSISWNLPKCDGLSNVLDFRLRLLASALEDQNSDEMLYLEEFLLSDSDSEELNSSPNFLRIPCAMFDIIHERFCFELISISKRSQHYQLWDRKCLRTEPMVSQANAYEYWEWSEWSVWSNCLCKRGEGAGSRKRARYCRRIDIPRMDRTTIGSRTAMQRKAFDGREGGCRRGEILQREQCAANCIPNKNKNATIVGQHSSALLISSTADGGQQRLLSSNATIDDCRCGCRLPRNSGGLFFATICPGKIVQKWILDIGRPFQMRILLLNRLLDNGYMFQILKDDEEESNFSLENSESVSIEGNFQKTAIFELRRTASIIGNDNFKKHRKTKHRQESGVLVEYKMLAYREFSSNSFFADLLVNNDIAWLKEFCADKQNLALCTVFLGFCILFLILVAIVLPPLICVCIARRYTKKKLTRLQQIYVRAPAPAGSDDSDGLLVSTHCHKQIDSEMLRSDNTESTKLSNSVMMGASRRRSSANQQLPQQQMIRTLVTVEQRSIGIQLSRQSTPRCVSRQLRSQRRQSCGNQTQHLVGDHSNGSIESATMGEDSTGVGDFWNEDDDFGAEELQLGMVVANSDGSSQSVAGGLVSDIDIDKIVRRETSDWIAGGSNVSKDKTLNGLLVVSDAAALF